MPFDSTLPADHAPVVSPELRAQFNGLKDLIDAQALQLTALQIQLAQCPTAAQVDTAIAAQSAGLPTLPGPGFSFSDPPTQAELQSVGAYLSLLYAELTRE